ncbi:MFS transporter [Anaeromusa sp.]|uniref:MFS transporter n=1 Tax=Anaeromusa sp. TaxID=1872520 RepID=UPI00261AEBA2|nr:MFS transporter [Anaeromusa sp.]MDD3158939.1 MFS transporter [Anaeromusa sp.]
MKKRWLVLGVSWIVFFVAFLDRVNLSVAMPLISKEFSLSPEQVGYLFSAFFISYTVFQIPGGYLSDKVGPKKVLLVALVWWSIMTMATGVARTFSQFFIVRVLFGIGEGLQPPCAFKLNSNWFPNQERATANAIFTSACSFGPAIAPSIAVAIIGLWGWHALFYIFGALGFVIMPLLYFFVKNSPEEDPDISKEELEYIKSGQTEIVTQTTDSEEVGLMSVLKNRNIVLLALTYFGFMCAFFGLLSWLPSYLVKARGFELVKMGIFSGLPFLALGIAQPFGGWLSDKVFKGKRKIQAMAVNLAAGPVLYGVVVAPTETVAMALLVCTGFLVGMAFGPLWAMPMESVKRSYVGMATGVMNAGGSIGGILSPIIIGYLVGMSGYNAAFVFMGGALVFTALVVSMVKLPTRAEA